MDLWNVCEPNITFGNVRFKVFNRLTSNKKIFLFFIFHFIQSSFINNGYIENYSVTNTCSTSDKY